MFDHCKGYEPLRDDSIEAQFRSKHDRWSAKNWALPILSHLTAVLTGLSLYKLLLMQGAKVWERQPDGQLQNTLFSALPSYLTDYSQIVQFNGTIDYPSIYRGASLKVDQAWHELVDIGYIDVDLSVEDISKFGIDPMTAARFPPEQGGGYLVTIEFAHQLHCVDLLRKVTHWNYPYYMARKDEDGSFQHSDQAFRVHVDFDVSCGYHIDRATMGLVHSWAREHEKENQTEPLRPDGAKMLRLPP